jgi:phenylacetate-CoA ligase
VGLEAEHICSHVTGKFVLGVKEDEDEGPRLHVIVELVPGLKPSDELRNKIAQSIRDTLLKLNSEYAHYVRIVMLFPSQLLIVFGGV